VFESRTRRILGGFFVLCILLSIVFDSIDGTEESDLTIFFLVVGSGGGAVFMGASLLRFLPDDRRNRWKFILMGGLSIVWGVVALVTGLASIWLH
jgi:uncharacterized membrane protein HdeD (DUF308 family)